MSWATQSFFSSLAKKTAGPALTTLGTLLLVLTAACTAPGPPFPRAPAGDPAGFSAVYFFEPPPTFYTGRSLGELLLETNTSGTRTYFELRVLGQTRNNSLRMRSYEGHAVRIEGGLELRAGRCYEWGKRELEDRLAPLERWTCDHLFFRFEPELPEPGGVLRAVAGKRTEETEWFYRSGAGGPSSTAIPLELKAMRRNDRPYFVGRVFRILPDGRVVVWGRYAGKRNKPGDKLIVRDAEGKADLTTLVIVSHPGDLLITRVEKAGDLGKVREGMRALRESAPETPGLF